ncbi:MAG: hypothetical protein ABH834_05070 [Candidatus Altiarchaeota archaeon]
MQEILYYVDEAKGEIIIFSGGNSLRLTEKEFTDIKRKRMSGILFGLHKATSEPSSRAFP